MNAAPTQPVSDRPRVQPQRVGDLLLEHGLVTREQIEEALAYQRGREGRKLLGEVLVELKFVTEEQVMECLARAYGLPFARVTPKLADPKVIELLPRDFLESQGVLPLFLIEGRLTLAMHEPTNVFVIEEVERLTGCTVQVVAATHEDIERTRQAYLPSGQVFELDELTEHLHEDDLRVIEPRANDLMDPEAAAGDSPVIKLVNFLIFEAVKEGASDIHIEPGENRLRVRYRVDGRLYEKIAPPAKLHPAVISRIKIMAGLDISERRKPQDGAMAVVIDKRSIDLRVSSLPGKHGEKAVLRIIDKSNVMIGLDRLGLGAATLERWRGVVHQPNGVVLVTGPTGSGKSTTLYSSLSELNDDALNVCTVEDPVEFSLPGVNQFQVNEKAGFTFASALRSLLRQDPDVIMVGEVRDQETARVAIQAALTGHLVLTTLHTNDAPSAVTRLVNMGVEPYLVAASVRGVLAQRLVRRVCPHCGGPAPDTTANQRLLERLRGEGYAIDALHAGTGCGRCRQTGYRGRVGLFELYVPDDEALDAISRGVSLQELRRLARAAEGFMTMREDGVAKLRAGLTTAEEVIAATTA